MKHYPNLDFLRTVAVLSVVVSHVLALFTDIPGQLLGTVGYFGVVIFFVHTSLVLMMSLERDHAASGSSAPLFTRFMVRRCFRIYPLVICAVAAVFLFDLPLSGGNSYYPERSFSALLSNLMLIQNITGKSSSPYVLWSLPYEIQMYLLLPALFLFCKRISNVFPLLFICAGAQIFAHIRVWYFPSFPDVLANLSLFIPGVMAFKILKSGIRPKLVWQLWPVAIGAALALLLLVRHDAPVITAVFLGIAIPWFDQIPSGAMRTWSERIAKFSFGIYLSHVFSIWLAFTKFAGSGAAVKWSLFGVLSVVFPLILFYGIEEPMIRMGVTLTNRMRDRDQIANTSLKTATAGNE